MTRTLALLALAINASAYGMASMPPYPPPPQLNCAAPVPVTTGSAYKMVQCWIRGYPYALDTAHVSIILPPTPKADLVISRHGYTRFPITCTNNNGSSPGQIVIKTCASYEPDQLIYGSNPALYPWGGPFLGVNNEGYVAAAAVEWVAQHYSVDWTHGITLQGSSEGGDFAMFQSMILPEPWRSMIMTVDAKRVFTMFTKLKCVPGKACKLADAMRAWGNYDISQLDVEKFFASGRADNIHFSIDGATNDDLGLVDLEFFRLCDKYKISCRGTWDLGGHELYGEPGINLPRMVYEDFSNRPRNDRPRVIFTESSANNYGARGHYNIGLSGFVGVSDGGRLGENVYLRYRRYTALGGGIPDTDPTVTTTVTLRGMKQLHAGDVVHYTLNENSGEALVLKDGEVTIPYLALKTSAIYTNLTITRM
jgi:hypothetical protein